MKEFAFLSKLDGLICSNDCKEKLCTAVGQHPVQRTPEEFKKCQFAIRIQPGVRAYSSAEELGRKCEEAQ